MTDLWWRFFDKSGTPASGCHFVEQVVMSDICQLEPCRWTTRSLPLLLLSSPQRCYEHKQYRNGLKFCKQILSNPKFAEHGGEQHQHRLIPVQVFGCVLNVFWCIVSPQKLWPWRAWLWTVWARRRRPTTWWDEACAMTSGATSVSSLRALPLSTFCECVCVCVFHKQINLCVYVRC